MFRVAVILACLALCHGHVLPFVPAAHDHIHYDLHSVPVAVAHHSLHHDHHHGYGFLDHSYHHHLYKRSPSPHIVPVDHIAPLGHAGHVPHVSPLAHVAPVAYVAPVAHGAPVPVAVSHQSRVDVRTAPAVAPVLAPVPVLPLAKTLVAPLAAPPLGLYGNHGLYAAHGLHGYGLHGAYPHLGHY